jgi:hypothetical protein
VEGKIMATIIVSFSVKDSAFALALAEKLKTSGHEIVTDELTPGDTWRSILSSGLKEADAFIALLSQASLSSKFFLMEVGSARAYAFEMGKPLVIPIVIDPVEIPAALQDIETLPAIDRNIEEVITQINRTLRTYAVQKEVQQKKQEEAARKIEAKAATYVEEAVKVPEASQASNNFAGKVWYAIGFAALILGIAFALLSLYRSHPTEIPGVAVILVTNVIVIGFLGACSRYAFSLGKSYISESLKSADRIHAIAFGQFYLRAFGEKATWSELKEVFQHWNIDRASTFSTLDVSQIDPQILAMIAQLSAAFGGKAKSGGTIRN